MPNTIPRKMLMPLRNSSKTSVSFQKLLLLSLESKMKPQNNSVVKPRSFSKILDPKKLLILDKAKDSLSLALKGKSSSLRREVKQ
jgi:hypothetical protein